MAPVETPFTLGKAGEALAPPEGPPLRPPRDPAGTPPLGCGQGKTPSQGKGKREKCMECSHNLSGADMGTGNEPGWKGPPF